MSSILSRVREILYESNEDLEGAGETDTGPEAPEDMEDMDDEDSDESGFDSDCVCSLMDEEGVCTNGAECANISAGDTCPYVADFDWKSCCGFHGYSDDMSSFGDNA